MCLSFARQAISNAFATHSERSKFGALFVVSDPLVFTNRIAINGFAIKEKLPTVHRLKEYAIDGGLISYDLTSSLFFAEPLNMSTKFSTCPDDGTANRLRVFRGNRQATDERHVTGVMR
jgi:hypothetical protein